MARILLVDDDTSVLHVIDNMLTRAGHQVVAVNSGREALARLGAESFDIVVTDIMMPDINGVDIALEIKSFLPQTPVLAISGANEALFEAMSHGADRQLSKPFSYDELVGTVECMLGIGHRRGGITTDT